MNNIDENEFVRPHKFNQSNLRFLVFPWNVTFVPERNPSTTTEHDNSLGLRLDYPFRCKMQTHEFNQSNLRFLVKTSFSTYRISAFYDGKGGEAYR